MKILSRSEEMILLAVWRLQAEAYGVSIREHLKEITGKDISIGGIYVPLDRLVRQGLLNSFQGEPTPERGGMSKRYYKLTREGHQALAETKQVHERMWAGLPELRFAD